MYLIERFETPLVVMAVAPGAGYPKVSLNGVAPVVALNTAVAVGEGFYGLRLSAQETNRLGTLLVIFGPGQGEVVQIRDVVEETAKRTRTVLKGELGLSVQQVNSLHDAIKLTRNSLSTDLQGLQTKTRARRREP